MEPGDHTDPHFLAIHCDVFSSAANALRRALPLVLTTLLLLTSLLQFNETHAADPAPSSQQNNRSQNQTSNITVIPSGAPTDEWFQITFDENPIGYERIRTRHIDASTPQHRILRTRESRITLVRFGRNLSVSADLETTETTDGSLLAWSLARTAGDGTNMERTGLWDADHNHYQVNEKIQGTRRERLIKCDRPPKSPIMSAWLPAYALAERKRRFTVDVLFPESAAVSEVQVQMSGPEAVRSPAGKNVSTEGIVFWPRSNPDQKTELFADQSAQVIRSEQTLLGSQMVLIKSDAATAVSAGSAGGLEMDLSGLIPVQRGISHPETRHITRLQITVPDGQQLSIPESTFQKVAVTSLSEVIVTLINPAHPESDNKAQSNSSSAVSVSRRSSAVAPEYSASTILVNSTDELVGKHARLSAGTLADPRETCRRMAHYLHSNLKSSPFSTSCQSSAVVAKSMRGDCTEHAVLLAAMMRASGIPSRVAIGLTYSDQGSAMIGHMWTEAWIEGQWIPYDSTRRSGQPGATSLKLADSSLPDEAGDGVLLFLPLLDLFGKAKIVVVADEPN